MRHSIKIKKTTRNRLKELSALLDQYRVFYEQETDPKKVYKFLKDRYRKNQSTIYIALINNKILGPTQLYPTYSTVSLEKFLILNDLFVVKEYRGHGIATQLLNKAKKHCVKNGYKGLALETAANNPARKLYERERWASDSNFIHYFWARK
jgi:GNAT superfamily N-acetyltransferase